MLLIIIILVTLVFPKVLVPLCPSLQVKAELLHTAAIKYLPVIYPTTFEKIQAVINNRFKIKKWKFFTASFWFPSQVKNGHHPEHLWTSNKLKHWRSFLSWVFSLHLEALVAPFTISVRLSCSAPSLSSISGSASQHCKWTELNRKNNFKLIGIIIKKEWVMSLG